jgi:hypothetical protein
MELETASTRSMPSSSGRSPRHAQGYVRGVVPLNTGRRVVGDDDDDEEWVGSGVVYDSMKQEGNEIILK